jgi:molecular chaperone Hsp33
MQEDAGGMLLRAFAGGRTVRLLAVEARSPAERTRIAHGLGPGGAQLAAEGVVATLLLSAYIQGEERLSVQVQGTRPALAFFGEVDALGQVRARLTPPDLAAVSTIEGALLALKTDGPHEVYRGVSEVRGTLEQALAAHLGSSAQVEAILRIDVAVDREGRVTRAYGFLLERLPEDKVHPWISTEEFWRRYGHLVQADVADVAMGIAFGRLAGGDVEPLEQRAVRWRCRCSRERVEATLQGLGATELADMIRTDGGAEVICHFCNEAFRIDADRLRELAGE